MQQIQTMNGVTHLEPDDSEFVEVDPTGRYGRVYSLSPHFLLSLLCLTFMMILHVSCSTMKSLEKELQRQCMLTSSSYFIYHYFSQSWIFSFFQVYYIPGLVLISLEIELLYFFVEFVEKGI